MSTAECTRPVADRLIVIRHAKADYPPGLSDRQRPINARGRRDALSAGVWLRDHADELIVGTCEAIVSDAVRTQQTWELVSRHLPGVKAVIEPRIYNADASRVDERLRESSAQTVIVVGHNPAMHDTVLTFTGADPLGLASSLAWKFPTCAIAVLDFSGAGGFVEHGAALAAVRLPRDE